MLVGLFPGGWQCPLRGCGHDVSEARRPVGELLGDAARLHLGVRTVGDAAGLDEAWTDGILPDLGS
ncbi:hypothetical protein ACIQEY_11625 [Streptomyces parvus]|uniref:hypothetical protein n=1 Tax=Streptomyces parvus TaxID=66428 RepID=UPI003819CBAC